jgi:hypothetical protein
MMRPAANRAADARIAVVEASNFFILFLVSYRAFPTRISAVVCCGVVSTRVVGFVRFSVVRIWEEVFMKVAAAKRAAATMMEVLLASK